MMKNLRDNGVKINLLNIMALDYGKSFNVPDLGQAAIQAVQNTEQQMADEVWTDSWRFSLGVVVMIGFNDIEGEVFQKSDMYELVDFAKNQKYIRNLGFWSLNRDVTDMKLPLYLSSKVFQVIKSYRSN
jgi:hypothetical protein